MSVSRLTARGLAEIEALAAACKQYEPRLNLPLYLEAASPTTGETSLFVHYFDDVLTGVVTLIPGDDGEVVGMVHPAHRRKGIGRALLGAARREAQRRALSGLTLVCEEASSSGQAFAQAVGAKYDSAEHRMELDRVRFAQCPPPHRALVIEPAGPADVDALTSHWMSSREVTQEEARRRIVRWLGQANQRFYIGRLSGEPVGMLRLHTDVPNIYINSFRVHTTYRGRGYGRQILMEVIERLIAEDWGHIMIEVATDNEIALNLYESCGFERVATYLYYWLGGGDESEHQGR